MDCQILAIGMTQWLILPHRSRLGSGDKQTDKQTIGKGNQTTTYTVLRNESLNPAPP